MKKSTSRDKLMLKQPQQQQQHQTRPSSATSTNEQQHEMSATNDLGTALEGNRKQQRKNRTGDGDDKSVTSRSRSSESSGTKPQQQQQPSRTTDSALNDATTGISTGGDGASTDHGKSRSGRREKPPRHNSSQSVESDDGVAQQHEAGKRARKKKNDSNDGDEGSKRGSRPGVTRSRSSGDLSTATDDSSSKRRGGRRKEKSKTGSESSNATELFEGHNNDKDPLLQGWDEVDVFGSNAPPVTSTTGTTDGFGGFPSEANFDAVSGFGGDGFSAEAFPAFPSTGQNDGNGSGGGSGGGKNLTKSDFGDAFAPTAFGDGPLKDPFGTTTAVGNFDINFDDTGFSSMLPVVQEAPVTKTWDKTPLKGKFPERFVPNPLLNHSEIFHCKFQGRPTNNPLNGNVIFCQERDADLLIHEIDPRRGNVQLACTPVLSHEFKHRVSTKYNATAYKVDSLLALTAGLHHANGQTRARVGVILDLRVLESRQVLRLVAVWQWGYGSGQSVSLQFTIAPPSGGDFFFDSSTLQIADGLLFLAGASPKGPCVFMCKPALKETWSANFLGGSGRVACMAVTPCLHRLHPYLAIALTDGSLNVWTYQSALASTKDSATSKRWLFPLCRLEHAATLSSVESSSLSHSGEESGPDSKDAGQCSCLEWLPPRAELTSLLMLAVAFQNGLAVFHVGLPVMEDESAKNGYKPLPEPSQGTNLAQAPPILPIVARRWQGNHSYSSVAWVDFGPLNGPGLLLLLHDNKSEEVRSRLVLGIVHFPLYRRSPLPKGHLAPLRILASTVITEQTQPVPRGLLRGSGFRDLFTFSVQGMGRVFLSASSLTVRATEGILTALTRPVTSSPSGLTSVGDSLFSDGFSDGDGVVHIFVVLQCERKKSSVPSLLEWFLPMQRFWLCRTIVGDTKQTSTTSEQKEGSGFGGREEVLGGSESVVLLELYHEKLIGYIPFRICQSPGSNIYSVAYKKSLSGKGERSLDVSLDTSLVLFVDCSGASDGTLCEVIEARDATFLPNSHCPRGLLLNSDGSSLKYFECGDSVRLESGFRPILGVDLNDSFVECRRVFSFSGAGKVVLASIGARIRDKCCCIVMGELLDIAGVDKNSWTNLLPNLEVDSCFWFEENEEVLEFIGLEGDDSGYRNFAVSTSTRVLILSSALTVLTSIKCLQPGMGLAPIGPFVVSYVSEGRHQYLCCLDDDLKSGSVSTLPGRQYGNVQASLLSIRQDRSLFLEVHTGARLVEQGQNQNSFLLSTGTTFPTLALEPLIANAVSVGGKKSLTTPVLRAVIEKFGRKIAAITHGESEGIGSHGAGISARVFQILGRYGIREASTWLLTGTVSFDRSANSRILPVWLPVATKAKGSLSGDTFLHLISSGDQYLSEYVKSPDQNMASTLPRPTDPASCLCRDFARIALQRGDLQHALKLLDLAGQDHTETLIVQLLLMMSKADSTKSILPLKAVSGMTDYPTTKLSGPMKASSALAALSLSLSEKNPTVKKTDDVNVKHGLKPLAPSLQYSKCGGRLRQKLVGEKDIESVPNSSVSDVADPLWLSACHEAKHVWNEGPRKVKENLLLLDRMEDWLGRRRPLLLGKEGAAAASDRGEKTLADILNKDDDSFGGMSDQESDKENCWVEGVGEGRSDEANLSAYFRMSDGEDEDSRWNSEGLQDLSPFRNKLVIVGDPGNFSLQPSTSSVDEGEPGKVKSLFDLVFQCTGTGNVNGVAISAARGCSIDIGVLHNPEKTARNKCSIEFWYFLPPEESFSEDIVLARRTMGPSADDFEKVCVPSEKEGVLWDLVVMKDSRELTLRSCGGSSLLSSQNHIPRTKGATSGGDDDRCDLVAFGKWNHVCVVFASKSTPISSCFVSLYMKGKEVAASEMSMLPSGFNESDLNVATVLDEIVGKSYMLFGIGQLAGFRLTELRVWACERSAEDTQSFLYEYLTAAEKKKKFQVKISNKNKLGGKTGFALHSTGNSAFPSRGLVATTKSSFGFGSTAPMKGISHAGVSLAPPPKEKFSLAPQNKDTHIDSNLSVPSAFEGSFNAFGMVDSPEAKQVREDTKPIVFPSIAEGDPARVSEKLERDEDDDEEMDVPATLWDTALPLSQQLRSSAAAALIRGPPATRHFGGNRGGLPDFSGIERFGVGGIAICGSEKTIVWRDNEDPPALTYPIGASGAIVSDHMDDQGSEFLCCFLAKERRMVVFELQSRTVVVELQMTTKLNYWRYLPPEAAENTLCFMLITPVGGFHWMPLEEQPRPHQVWKRGPDLQGKKVVSYEEGGSNGLDEEDIRSRVGLIMVTKSTGAGFLEAWIIPIVGDSQAVQVSDDVMGACLCQPPFVDDGPFLPLMVTVHHVEDSIYVNVLSVVEQDEGSVELGEVEISQTLDITGFALDEYEPPNLAMGTFPEAIVCSLSNIIVVIVRRKGLIAAFELEDDNLSPIAQEGVGHYVIDAVMRYSAEVGGAEIVMLLADNENLKDGRIVSFCFRSAA